MLLLIWCAVGLLLGIFVHRRSVAWVLAAVVWAIMMATVAARAGTQLLIDRDSVGVFVTLVAAVLGCLVGVLLRERRHLIATSRST